MPKISICIPAYENAGGIQRLLKSISEQLYGDYEIILTDDSASDAVEKAVKESGLPVRYVRNHPRRGAIANWNEAVSLASGEYIKLMHHDDWFTDGNSLAAFASLLDLHPEADLAFCGSRQVRTDGSSYERAITKEQESSLRLNWRSLYLENGIGAPSAVIVRARVLSEKKIQYDENLTWLVDSEYYMHILQENPVYSFTVQPLVSIGMSEGQLTYKVNNDAEIQRREYLYIYKKYDLQQVPACRKKLAAVYAEYHTDPDVTGKETGLDAAEYSEMRQAQKRAERKRHTDTLRYLRNKVCDRMAGFANLCLIAGLLIEVGIVIADKSQVNNLSFGMIYRISFALFAVKMVFTRYTKREYLFVLFWLIIGTAGYLCSGANDILRLAVFCAALVGSDLNRIGRIWLWTTAAGCAGIILLSVSGIFGDVVTQQTTGDGIYRSLYSFGMGNSNAFAAMMSMLTILFLYLYDRTLRQKAHRAYLLLLLGIIALHCVFFLLCRSVMAFLAGAGAGILFLLMYLSKRARENRGLYIAGEVLFAGGIIFSVLAAAVPRKNPVACWIDDHLLTGRIVMLWQGTQDSAGIAATWRLFGAPDGKETYFDLGFVRMFYWYGIIPAILIVLFILAMYRAVRRRRDYRTWIMLTVCMLYTVMEAHFVSEYLGRNFLLLAAAEYIPIITEGGFHASDE